MVILTLLDPLHGCLGAKVGNDYYLSIVPGNNPSADELKGGLKEFSFNYLANRKAAKSLGIEMKGRITFRLTAIIPCPALNCTFIIRGEKPDSSWRFRGTYYAKSGTGRVAIRKISG